MLPTVVDGVHQVDIGYVNSFIVDRDEGVTLIDTLLPRREGIIAEGLKEIGRSLDDVTAIVLTHSHADHSGGAAAIKAESDATLWAGERDAPAIRGEERPPRAPAPLYALPLAWFLSMLPAPPRADVDRHVDKSDGDPLPSDLQAIDTRGHTPGHWSYLLDRDGGVLFVGDAGGVARSGDVSRGWFNRSTPEIDASLRRMAELRFDKAVFGHSAPIRSAASGAFRDFAETLG